MKLHVRSMITAPKGFSLISVDLSQAESWCVAFLANEPNMKKALMFGDIHTETAGSALFFNDTGCPHSWNKLDEKEGSWICAECKDIVTKLMRYVGKRYNHASSYRMGAPRAAEVINKDSDKPPYFTVTLEESKRYSEAWNAYYNLRDWWSGIEIKLSENARKLVTTYGRERVFYGQWGNELFKEATAFEPQSTVADHFNGQIHPQLGIRGGLREIYKQYIKPYKDDGHKIINQAHDSCIVEVPTPVVEEIGLGMMRLLRRPLVINGEEFTIPVDGEWGPRWTEMVKLKEAA
jgi:hypothetical protein